MKNKFTYSQGMLAFLRRGYIKMSVPNLTAAFNKRYGHGKSESQIRSTLKNHRYKCGRPPGGGDAYWKPTLFTEKQTRQLSRKYVELTVRELTAWANRRWGMNLSDQQLKSFIANHGVSSGRTGQWKEGHVAWNNGTKGQGLTGPNPGSFMKGDIPGNTKPMGHERICSKDGYILIKVPESNPYTGAETRYKAKHIWLWQQEHGPVPPDHLVRFIDGDKLHCQLENLECIHRALHCRLNKLQHSKAATELQPTIRAIAMLQVKQAGLAV